MVYRVYVEKKPGFDVEARQLADELTTILGISALTGVRIVNRYDVEGISADLFERTVPTVFSEPPVDTVSFDLPDFGGDQVFATEYLPGQFDQRADSASECIQLISQGERPAVRSAKVYALAGELSEADVEAIKRYVINPVESREASLAARETLKTAVPTPGKVEVIDGFRDMDAAAAARFIDERGLAMDLADLEFCQAYFREQRRDPTITEIRVIDTYWSDHCRHTTFGTELTDVAIDDATVQAAFQRYLKLRQELGREAKPVCLMDMGTIGAKWLKANGVLTGLDESEEINACTVKAKVDVNGEQQDWLFLFKNETHNHPTEIEPFGGAATCIGGCIRDPLSGRSYVYQAMRVTGAGDPTVPVSETLKGKLPQRKIVTTAAAGYSSYGNQIGLATGQVNELYHPGYVAKRMEVGAVVAATPADHVRRETPAPGDRLILLGGRTGRDGIGGATGASKAHNVESLELDGAEVQKGNAPVERKLQRLFRRGDACRLIKRCNDFGAGGVSVACGEIADGLTIDLNAVPKKYEGLDGTELAISESQERMAVDVAADDVEEFLGYAREENLDATVIGTVTEDPRMVMSWNGDEIVNLTRAFLASNGAPKHQAVHVEAQGTYEVPATWRTGTLAERMHALVTDLNVASNKGLAERFDSTIGAATVLMPFGGARQLTPTQAMVAKLPVDGETTTASAMAWGFNPYLMSADQFTGAYLSVVESLAKLVATGFEHEKAYLSFQEYFEKLRDDPERWGKPMAAVLGALMAQIDLGAGAIGGKDSMSGSFEDLDVPPTLVSFAVALGDARRAVSPEFKGAGHRVFRIAPRYRADGLTPEPEALLETFALVESLTESGVALAVSTPGYGATAEALFRMTLGNRIGLTLDPAIAADDLFRPAYGSFLVELKDLERIPAASNLVEVGQIGETTEAYELAACGETLDLARVQEDWESGIESVFPYRSRSVDPADEGRTVEALSFAAPTKHVYAGGPVARPRVVIPVFPGTNCEYDTAAAFRRAGAEATTLVVNNLTPQAVAESTHALAEAIRGSQIVMIPGGFSGGDEPDGSAKFITAFFRAPEVTEAVRDLLRNRDGLMLGICNGFQALIKLGLVPFGDIVDATEGSPTLTFNTIGRHQSRLVRTRVASDLSPWLAKTAVGDVHTVAISHGEGRFVASPETLAQLKANGQIATQYVDEAGVPGMDLDVNPNGSLLAVEGITSPDGRVFGKMGHSERAGENLYRNVPGNTYQPLFEAGVEYFAA
ncbi:phosphoribosylformylglycinamidine synthase [Bifidobacterium pullorum subsp. saeculare]|uniref:Phosphoribosylformylglycinamidine synthase n=1 Tax=Bifidobacterium pullorum subsp. saeculare TaxID=78257 RepID=A0A939B8T6_9BIFI|nr:phosphoribosylformylglycinamidine synthase [Bifidobacterium pullorum]MBM6698808.1 phosphoribosylformylglycinamidine synthase [Bifidobacterium pullorum subsp. saeculare]